MKIIWDMPSGFKLKESGCEECDAERWENEDNEILCIECFMDKE